MLLPAEKHTVAVHEAGHALVAALCEHADPAAQVTILPAGQALGVTERASMEYPSCASWRITANEPGLPAVRVRRRSCTSPPSCERLAAARSCARAGYERPARARQCARYP